KRGASFYSPLDAGGIQHFLKQGSIRNIGDAVQIKHALRRDAAPHTRTESVEATDAPPLNNASQDTRTVTHQQLAGTNGQIDIAVASEDMRMVAVHDRVVR